MNARPAPLTLVEADERRGDRRVNDRRAPRRTLDPLFAATLVNQVAPAERVYVNGYAPSRRVRAGVAFNVRA